jgi:hypothetical protein
VRFVPSEFEVPDLLEHDRFRLRPLTVHDLVKDYDAVMSSREHLWDQFGQAWGWPPADLTLEQDLIDLGWHQKEFQLRRSFAYTVVNLSESAVLGCVYIEPTKRRGYDAVVFLWTRQSELAGGLEKRLYDRVKNWIKTDWPFMSVAFPGRDIPWEAWKTMPVELR